MKKEGVIHSHYAKLHTQEATVHKKKIRKMNELETSRIFLSVKLQR